VKEGMKMKEHEGTTMNEKKKEDEGRKEGR
jgi:hypothetical protein